MIVAIQHLQHRPRQLQRALHRLIRIGVRPQRQRPRGVARLAQLLLQQLRHIRLEDQLGLEVEAGRISEIRVRRPRIAVDAAVLAAPVRVHRTVEADIGRAVPAYRRLRRIARQRGGEFRQFAELGGQRVPAVVERADHLAVEPHRRIGDGAATLPGQRGHVASIGLIAHGVFPVRSQPRLAKRGLPVKNNSGTCQGNW